MLKNRILYVIGLVGVGYLDYHYHTFILDVLFYALIAVVPLSILSILVTLSNVDISATADKQYYKKQEWGILTINIANTSHFIVSNIRFKPTFSFGINMEDKRVDVPVVFAKQSYSYEMKFSSKYRGGYDVGITDIWIRDYFNLFRYKIRRKVCAEVVYLPNIIMSENPIYRVSNSDQEKLFGIDFIEQDVMVDIRNYEYGDPLKKIHWKLSAKSDELLVKKYSSNKEQKLSVIIDTMLLEDLRETSRIVVEDQIIEQAVAVIYNHLQRYTGVRVINSVADTFELEHQSDFEGLYRYLAKYPFKGHNDVSTIVKAYFEANEEKLLTDTNNIIIVTHQPTPELYGLLVDNKFGDHHFKVVLMLYGLQRMPKHFTQLINRMSDAGITVEEHWIGGI